MASIKISLDKRRADRAGTYPLKVSISNGGTTALHGVGIRLAAGQWDDTAQKVVGHPCRAALNAEISRLSLDWQEQLRDLQRRGATHGKTARQLKEAIIAKLEADSHTGGGTLLEWLDKQAARQSSPNTRHSYEYAKSLICKYDRHAEGLQIDAIRREWVEGFVAFMAAEGIKTNSRFLVISKLKAIFNYAMDNEATTNYPFRRMLLRKEPTRKRNIPPEELRDILTYEEARPAVAMARDVFALSFYLIGINVSDLFGLSWDNVVDGRLEYKRRKTGRAYSIKIEPEAWRLLLKYLPEDGDGPILFHDKWACGVPAFARHLKQIRPYLSTYWARHSWATIAASLDISRDVIGQALGHSDGCITDVYIERDRSKVDKANRTVIDFVLGLDLK